MAANEVTSGSRAILRIEVYVEQNDPANNRSLVRLIGSTRDGSTTLGGTGTGSWNIGIDGAERGAGSFGYNFTGNSGNNYVYYNATEWLTHSATNGSRTISAYTNFNWFNSFIPATGVSVGLTLTDYELSTGNIWNGTGFVKGVAYMWNGTAFVQVVPKLWDGSNFIGV